MDKWSHPEDLRLVRYSSGLICALRNAGFTPNMVTGLSIVFSLVALWFLWKRQLVGFIVFALLAYWCDDLDGAMARRFKMTSPFGELLDHASDALFFVGVVFVLVMRYRALRQPWLLTVLLASSLLPSIHYAAAAKVCGNHEGVTGLLVSMVAPRDGETAARVARRLRCVSGIGYQVILIGLVLIMATRQEITSST